MVARGDGALPEQPSLRHLPGLPAEAGGAGGEDRRPARRRGGAPVDPRGAGLGRDRAVRVDRPAQRDRPRHPEGDPRAPRLPGQRRPRLPHARPQRRHPLRRREPAHPPRQPDRQRPHRRPLRAGRALHRPAPARQRAAPHHAEEPARRRQHRHRRRARRGGDPRGRPRHRHRPRRRRARRRDHRRGHPRRHRRRARIDHRPVSHRPARHPDPARAPQGQRKEAQGGQRHRQQPPRRHRHLPARHLHLRHRRLRRRQVDADHRDPVQDRLHAAERRPPDARALRGDRGTGASRQGHRHRPVAHRPHAALQPGHLHRRLRSDPRLVRRAAGEQGARLQARPLLASTSRAAAARPARATA